ncbi:hypothetical protein C6502_01280 [Candidatus Poribacteria bacterium]|nr:MAG: hypothetical protein C6502_01280 [Candidatus Poribacteria bacterium]
MGIITSPLGTLNILPRRLVGIQYSPPTKWNFSGTVQPLKLIAGDRTRFDFTENIENAMHSATYNADIGSFAGGSWTKDSQLSKKIVEVPNEQEPIIIINLSGVDVGDCSIYIKLTHVSPNEDPCHSLWIGMSARDR